MAIIKLKAAYKCASCGKMIKRGKLASENLYYPKWGPYIHPECKLTAKQNSQTANFIESWDNLDSDKFCQTNNI
jgi:hypothetical protein